MKNKFLKLLRWFSLKIFPELKNIPRGDFDYSFFKNTFINNEIEELVKYYSPYKISNSKIGKGTYIASNSVISMSTIGKFCSIGPNLICGWGIHPTNGVSTHPYFFSTLKQNGSSVANSNLFQERKPILIGNDVFIGANVTILDGVSIGDGAIIGAGAVVSKDIPDYAIAVGVPIQVVKYRFNEELRSKLKESRWWDFDLEKIKLVNEYFFDVDLFIKEISKN